MSLPWPGAFYIHRKKKVKTEQVSVVAYSDELRQEVKDLPDCEIAGSPRNAFRRDTF